MGLRISQFFKAAFGDLDAKISMVGLDAAGKTTVLLRLHLGETPTTIPTIGFNVEKVKYKSLTMTIWDVGGQGRLRPLWHYYYTNNDAIIYVIDSADRERVEESRDELHRVLSDEQLRGVPLLVFANKQDLPRAQSVPELSNALGLAKVGAGREWYVQGCCAVTGEGMVEGMEWLSTTIKRRRSA
jgi:small GTP-binding protein